MVYKTIQIDRIIFVLPPFKLSISRIGQIPQIESISVSVGVNVFVALLTCSENGSFGFYAKYLG